MENGEWEVRECSQHCFGESGMMGVVIYSAQREVRFVGGVCVWARTDNPTTLHSPAITASTTQQKI